MCLAVACMEASLCQIWSHFTPPKFSQLHVVAIGGKETVLSHRVFGVITIITSFYISMSKDLVLQILYY